MPIEPERRAGTILSRNTRGFGFIRDDSGCDWFFHLSELRGGLVFDQLQPDQRVVFTPVPDDVRGPRANDVEPARG